MSTDHSQYGPSHPIQGSAKIIIDHLRIMNSNIWIARQDGTPFETTETYYDLIDDTLRVLKNEFAKLSAPALRHHKTLQPIHRLPVEILIRIFELLVLNAEGGHFASDYSLFGRRSNISLVCSDWKAIVDGSPSMWAVISTAMPLELVKLSLQRSGMALLKVIYEGAGWGFDMDPGSFHSFGDGSETPSEEDEEEAEQPGDDASSNADIGAAAGSVSRNHGATAGSASKRLLLGEIHRWRGVAVNHPARKDINHLRLQLAPHLRNLVWKNLGRTNMAQMSSGIATFGVSNHWKQLQVLDLNNPPIESWKASLFSGLRCLTITNYYHFRLREFIETLCGSPQLHTLRLEEVDGLLISPEDPKLEVAVLADLTTFNISLNRVRYAVALHQNIHTPSVEVYSVKLSSWPLLGEETLPGIQALLSTTAKRISPPFDILIELRYQGPTLRIITVIIETLAKDNAGSPVGRFETSYTNRNFPSIFSELSSEFDGGVLRDAPTVVTYEGMWFELDPHTGYLSKFEDLSNVEELEINVESNGLNILLELCMPVTGASGRFGWPLPKLQRLMLGAIAKFKPGSVLNISSVGMYPAEARYLKTRRRRGRPGSLLGWRGFKWASCRRRTWRLGKVSKGALGTLSARTSFCF